MGDEDNLGALGTKGLVVEGNATIGLDAARVEAVAVLGVAVGAVRHQPGLVDIPAAHHLAYP